MTNLAQLPNNPNFSEPMTAATAIALVQEAIAKA